LNGERREKGEREGGEETRTMSVLERTVGEMKGFESEQDLGRSRVARASRLYIREGERTNERTNRIERSSFEFDASARPSPSLSFLPHSTKLIQKAHQKRQAKEPNPINRLVREKINER